MVRQRWWLDIKSRFLPISLHLMATSKAKELCFSRDLPHRKWSCSSRLRGAQPVLSWCQEWQWPINWDWLQTLPRMAAQLGLLGRWCPCIHLQLCWLHSPSASSSWTRTSWRWYWSSNCPWTIRLRCNSSRFRRRCCSYNVPHILNYNKDQFITSVYELVINF